MDNIFLVTYRIMFFLLLLPALQSLLYSISFGRQPMRLKFLIVSDEMTSNTIDLCSSDRLPYIGELNCTIPKPFTCKYAEILNETLEIVSIFLIYCAFYLFWARYIYIYIFKMISGI